MDLSLISESDWTKNLPKRIKGKKLKETKVVQEQKDLSLKMVPKDVVRRLHTSSRNLLKAISSLEKVGEVWPWGQAQIQVMPPTPSSSV